MTKIYTLLLILFGSTLLKAQTTANVNFTFVLDPVTNVVVFNNTSSSLGDASKKAFWSFGDGSFQTSGALDGATHHYVSSGTYQVCLKIYKYISGSNDSILLGSECKSLTLQSQTICTANFQFHDTISISPLTHHVTFNGTGSNNVNSHVLQVCWNFGDGTDTCINATAGTSITSFLNIRHEYRQNGSYTACLKIKYDGGCVAEKCNSIVLSTPTIADSCAANFAVHSITATSLGRRFVAQPWHSNSKKPIRICLTFGDGKDTCIQYTSTYTGDFWVEHTYANYGQYEACVIIKYDGGCEKKKCDVVTIASPVPAGECTFTIIEAATNVSNAERKFYVGLQAGRVAERICWNFGDGTDTCIVLSSPLNAQQLMVSHHYTSPGNYSVCAKVNYVGGCNVYRCIQVAISIPRNNICGGYMTDSVISANTIRFRGTGIQNASDHVVSYNWTFGDGTQGSGEVVNHTYGAPGHYSVCLYLKTATGCETRICKQVEAAGNSQPLLVLSPTMVATTLNALFHSLFQQSVSVKIYNASGLMVRSYTRSAVVGTNTWTFDVGALPTGVYSVIVQSSTQFATAIFFKQ
ncbi:MAG: PKD domain-containing protein [Bacteroidota bacterium]|nr:PKD domain-containing protein [Bacteroidota bacterium]